MKSRAGLNTEKRNSRSFSIDSMSTIDVLKTINEEDSIIAGAVKAAIPEIDKTVKYTINSIKNGGRVFYVGAGTSG